MMRMGCSGTNISMNTLEVLLSLRHIPKPIYFLNYLSLAREILGETVLFSLLFLFCA